MTLNKKFKIKKYKGETLNGALLVTLKIDGVRLHVINGAYLSRAQKPLYNLPKGLEDGIYEIYRKNFKETISVVRACKSDRKKILKEEVYRIDSKIDPRLVIEEYGVLSPEDIKEMLDSVVDAGGEGLVIVDKNTYTRWKVKKSYTTDVRVEGIIPGKGKYVGMLGAFKTNIGNVGTGLTDVQRVCYYTEDMIGQIIEVGYMEKTEAGKCRHPRFIRVREDKNEPNEE